ncbi:MAG TPA: hypothetical protein VHS58_20370, partial [Acetobacteraceae bacterium]|nr:hypothetical protein [Acetobacteraceae bacterium]
MKSERVALTCAIAAVVGLCMWATEVGKRAYVRAEAQEASDIRLENNHTCGSLSMPSGSDQFAACAAALDQIRKLHE